jgi:surfactin synthase thioesterase subunit
MSAPELTSARGRPATHAMDRQWFRWDPPHAEADLYLVCLPHAGGGASTFRTWRACLPDRVGVLAVQYPGHQGRASEPLCATFDGLVASLAGALTRSVSSDIVLFGHSFGTLVAFELARILRRMGGLQPRHLFVSGSRPPDVAPCGPIVHAWSDRQLLDYVVDLGGVPSELLAERVLIDSWLPIIRADLRMDETYRYTPAAPLDCPITAFAGEYERDLPVACVDGWRRHTTRDFRLVPLQTGHFWTPESSADALAIVGGVLRGLLDARRYSTRNATFGSI